MEIKKLNVQNIEEIKFVINESFSQPPWNDDWSDEKQFHLYILDLIDNKNSLSLGLYDNEVLIAVSLGRIKHWYEGTEYWIDDLAVLPQFQGLGYGSNFIKQMEDYLKQQNISAIVLRTQKGIPAYDFYVKNGFSEKSENVYFDKKL